MVCEKIADYLNLIPIRPVMSEQQIRILLIDDEEKIVTRLSRILAKDGYLVESTTSGADALHRLERESFDIVLTDLNMPDKSGFEVMDFIQSRGIKTLPLVLTGYASVEGAIQAIKYGAYDFIEKPIDAPTLSLVMKRAVESIYLRKQNEENMKELRKLNDLKNEFLSVVSHDLRSPLSTIGGYVNFLLKKGNLDDMQQKYLVIIREISDSLYILVNELLDISKIETGIIQLTPESTDIAELIGSSINNFLILAVDKNNTIDFYNDLSDTTVVIDRMKMLQVMNNLINNAIKFTEGGKIAVRLSGDESQVKIEVDDTGVGIPPEMLEKLFFKYGYWQNVGTRGEGGSGLGLVICKKFIELHGGSIEATSAPGIGSKFAVTVPRKVQ